jgi:hypothetical protein
LLFTLFAIVIAIIFKRLRVLYLLLHLETDWVPTKYWCCLYK